MRGGRQLLVWLSLPLVIGIALATLPLGDGAHPVARRIGGLQVASDVALRILSYGVSARPVRVAGVTDDVEEVTAIVPFDRALTDRRWDVVIVARDEHRRDAGVAAQLERLGYVVIIDDPRSLVAWSRERVRLDPLMDDALVLRWKPYAAPAGSRLDLVDGLPAVTDASPEDAGFMSTEFSGDGPLVMQATVIGTVTGSGLHAAHLSLLNLAPVIEIPPGTYDGSRSFRGFIEPPAGAAPLRIAFGLGGWASGAGDIRLVHLTVFRCVIASGQAIAVAEPRTGTVAFFVASLVAMLVVAQLGRLVVAALGLPRVSLLGGGFVVGYAFVAGALVLALRCFGNAAWGAGLCVAVLALFSFLAIRRPRASPPPSAASGSLSDLAFTATIVAWAAIVAATYLPMQLSAGSLQYRLPDIYDLPKHVFAARAMVDATSWPPPNPFFRGDDFAYNVGFYALPALIVRLLGAPLALFQALPMAIVMVAVAAPLAVLDLTRRLTSSKAIQFGSALLATWVGGLTPLAVHGMGDMGNALHQVGLIRGNAWIEEMFAYVVFVPQHVFAGLCVMLCCQVLAPGTDPLVDPRRDRRRLVVSGMLVVGGSLSSLLALPYLVAAHLVGGAWLCTRQAKADMRFGKTLFAWVAPLLAPIVVLLPFMIEARGWSAGGARLVTWPLWGTQWIYVAGALGLVVPLALLAFVPGPVRRPIVTRSLALAALLCLTGLIVGIRHPDAALKSGLFLRILLVPLAAIGLRQLSNRLDTRQRRMAIAGMAALFLLVAGINLPTIATIVSTGWQPIAPEQAALIDRLRRLPANARIVLMSPEQGLAAATARAIDFDFRLFREDAYLPPGARLRVASFWDRVDEGNPEAMRTLVERYDYAVAPLDSAAAARLASPLQAREVLGGYALFRFEHAEAS